jgi:carbamoyl-phosphate synthase large subunit
LKLFWSIQNLSNNYDRSYGRSYLFEALTTKSIIENFKSTSTDWCVLPTMRTNRIKCVLKQKRIWALFNENDWCTNAITYQDREQFTTKDKCTISSSWNCVRHIFEERNCTRVWFSVSDSASFTWGTELQLLQRKKILKPLTRGLEASPIHEVLIDKSFEMEGVYELEL